MKLKVNGQVIRVVDRIEIEIEVPKDGDTLLNGFCILIRGGPLTIESGDSKKNAALWIQSECTRMGDICFYHDKPLTCRATTLPKF